MAMIRERYPDDWDAIALTVKQEANWQCEQCGKPCRKSGESIQDLATRLSDYTWLRELYDGETPKIQRFTLTVAHLDQDPQNCDLANLKALCSVCHLNYDRSFRPAQRRLRAEWYGQMRIDDPGEAGLQLSLIPDRVGPYALPFQGDAPTEGKAISPPEQSVRLEADDKRISDQSCSGGDGRSKRRHTPKGSASGWIEQRQGNKCRKNPTVSYYYRWDEPDDRGSVYLPVAISDIVKRMVEVERRPVSKVLEFIQARKKDRKGKCRYELS